MSAHVLTPNNVPRYVLNSRLEFSPVAPWNTSFVSTLHHCLIYTNGSSPIPPSPMTLGLKLGYPYHYSYNLRFIPLLSSILFGPLSSILVEIWEN